MESQNCTWLSFNAINCRLVHDATLPAREDIGMRLQYRPQPWEGRIFLLHDWKPWSPHEQHRIKIENTSAILIHQTWFKYRIDAQGSDYLKQTNATTDFPNRLNSLFPSHNTCCNSGRATFRRQHWAAENWMGPTPLLESYWQQTLMYVWEKYMSWTGGNSFMIS